MFLLKKSSELNLLVLAIVLLIQRMALPNVNFIFVPYTSLLFCYFAIKYIYTRKPIPFLSFFRAMLLFLVLSVYFFISAITSHLNLMIIKEIVMMILISGIFVILFTEIQNVRYLKQLTRSFVIQIIVSSGFLSVLGIIKFILVLAGKSFFLSDNLEFTTSPTSDYNFFALSGILGLISILYYLFNFRPSGKTNFLLQILMLAQSLSVLFAGSRRGFAVYAVILVFVYSFNLYILLQNEYKQYETRIFVLTKSLIFLIIAFYFASYNTNLFATFKRSSVNVNFVSNTFFGMASRYASIFNISSVKIENFVGIKRDPKYPFTRWGTRIHKEPFPLEGINSDIVPEGSVGYKLDSTCNASTWSGNAYAYTSLNSLFSGDLTSETDHNFLASVYCYVSPDYDGSRVWLGAEGISSGKFLAIYDTLKKGEWQKLFLDFKYKGGIAPVNMYMSKTGAHNFKGLKGFVIFAYPEYGLKKSNHPDSLSQLPLKLNERKYVNSAFFGFMFSRFQNDSIQNIEDPFILKDGAELTIPRSERMRYSLHIFRNEYSLTQKFFGGGLQYMEKFGTKFGSVEFDYPHNPIISTLLYSGILGCFVYGIFIIIGFIYYLKYSRFHLYFFVCYVIVLFFSILSANTHFSIPVFTFLSLIPFLTHTIVNREKQI